VPDSFVARRSGRHHKVTEGQYKEIASYGIDGSAKPGATGMLETKSSSSQATSTLPQSQAAFASPFLASTTGNALALAVYQPSPHVIDTAFCLVNIPNQPIRGAAPYL